MEDDLKEWYHVRYAKYEGMPKFSELTNTQKAAFARSLDFSFWKINKAMRSLFNTIKSDFVK